MSWRHDVENFVGVSMMFAVLRFLLVAARVVDSADGPRVCVKEHNLQWLFGLVTDSTRTGFKRYILGLTLKNGNTGNKKVFIQNMVCCFYSWSWRVQEINSPWSGLLIYVLKVFPSLLSDAVLVGFYNRTKLCSMN